ncbi:MAG: MFS transporter [Methylobacteriaceae bacterium]|nr:MFS transporter [Methylobacteriaceae bacterium]
MSETAPTPLPPTERWRAFAYLGGLIILVSLADPNGGLMDIPVSFLLKNKLHLEASEVARFRLVAAIPLYLSFVFGLLRDTWNPFGIKDRGLLAIFGATGAVLYLTFAFIPISYGSLLAAMVLLTMASLFVASAQNGLTSTLGQQHAMSGQVSAVWNIFTSIPGVLALVLGGSLSQRLEAEHTDAAARILFLVGAASMGAIFIYSALRPRSVFDNVHLEHGTTFTPLKDLKRVARHWPAYCSLTIWLLWNFAPGSTTPLQFYLQNTLHASDADWGVWNAIFAASFIPTYMIFGFLCRHVPLKRLLFWGTIVAIPQYIPLLFAPSIRDAFVAAAAMGLMGGMATAAYLALIIRSCPHGLQGTTLMMSGGLYYVSSRFGDVLGTHLYEMRGGFYLCAVLTTLCYALILAVLRLVPRDYVDSPDGEAPPVSLA